MLSSWVAAKSGVWNDMRRLHDVEGEFHLFGAEGGRTRAVVSGYRPAHKIHEN